MLFKSIILLTILVLNVNCWSIYHDPHFVGDRKVIVQMLEWRFDDIATECEVFFKHYGYGGIQVSPINEYRIIDSGNAHRPWYERYQPVSYKIGSRSGNESQFINMVDRCNKAGIRIYVDVVLNHMTGADGKGKGTAGSDWDGYSQNFPGVPFNKQHFNNHTKCPTDHYGINDWNNRIQARNCRLVNLLDLDQGNDHVRNKQIEFLNKLIDIGVAGFRVDASKHMWPADLNAIFSKLHNLNTEYFPANKKPFIYHEVIYLGGNGIPYSDYLSLGRCLEHRYPLNIGEVFRNRHNQMLKWLRNFGKGWDFMDDNDAVALIDSHDLQRGHTGNIEDNISFFDFRLLKMSTAFMLAWPYGVTKVMSSYHWPRNIQKGHDINDYEGPPHNNDYTIKHVIRNNDLTCGNGWICEHRWRQIYNMVKFRVISSNCTVNNWWNNNSNQIAFSRGNKAFIAINNDPFALNQKLTTGLPAGKYCDVISGNIDSAKTKCSGRTITVSSDGKADIYVDDKWEDPMVAFHVDSKLK